MTRTCHGCGATLPPSRAPGRARKWCSERCRKASYGDPCVDCGTRTTYGAETARVPEPRCPPCAHEHARYWTADRIIERIQAWNTIYGEPPAIPDWNTWAARHGLHDEARALRFEAGHWPAVNTVIRMFGTWNTAIQTAGFQPRATHGGGGNELRHRSVRQRVAA